MNTNEEYPVVNQIVEVNGTTGLFKIKEVREDCITVYSITRPSLEGRMHKSNARPASPDKIRLL